MKKIYFEVNGGLGNQLFQLATAFAFAKKFDARVVLDTRGCDSGSNFHSSWHLQSLVDTLKQEINCSVRRSNSKMALYRRKCHDFLLPKLYIDKSDIEEVYQNGLSKKTNYFFPVRESRFLVKQAMNFGFNASVEKLKEFIGINNLLSPSSTNSVGIHLRRNDRKFTEYAIPDSWFITQINSNKSRIEELICFTDSRIDAEFLHSLDLPTRIYGDEITPLIALLSLSNFKEILTSNSTFSFWAGTLGKEKVIVSPLDSNNPLRPFEPYIYKSI